MQKTLSRREHDLADPARQRARLAELDIPAFEDSTGGPLTAGRAETLQINVGRRCNQVCAHCHVDAGPHRDGADVNMGEAVAVAVVAALRRGGFELLDVTGGAPELNPHFRTLVREARGLGIRVMDRCNLSVLFEPGQEDLGRFLADHRVEVTASLRALLRLHPLFEPLDHRTDGPFKEAHDTRVRLLPKDGLSVGGSGLGCRNLT